MKLLVICHYGIHENTPRSFRTIELVRALKKDYYEVDVLVGSERKLYEDITDEQVETIRTSVGSTSVKKFKVLRKIGSTILNYIYGDMVILKCYRKNLNIVKNKKYDAIISIGQPFYPHMISAKCKACNPIRIADCGDPFYTKGKGIHIKWLQKNVLSKMDYISIPTEKAVNYYEEYIDREKIKIIPQGVDFSRFKICDYKKNTVPTFGYAGVFYEGIRDPRKFLNYILRLDTNYKFILYTDLNNPFFKKEIEPLIHDEKSRIEIHGLVARDKCLYELSKMDFVINFENLSSTQAPSKLIDYGIIKRPVLSFSEETFKTDEFEQFLRGDYSNKLEFDISQYDINNVVKNFERLFRK